MEGYLRKQDHTALVKGWKKRYFRLATTPPATLYYYKEATSKEPIDGVPLANTKTYEHSLGDRKTDGLVFIVETKDRQYILAADSKPELQQWVSAIQRAAAPAPAPVAVKQAIPVKQVVRPPSARGATPAAAPPTAPKDEFADDMAKMMADLMQEEKSRGGGAPLPTTATAAASTPAVSAASLVPSADTGRRNRAASRQATDLSKALADPNALAQLEAEAMAANAANPVVPVTAQPRRGATLMGSRAQLKPQATAAPPPPVDQGLPPPNFGGAAPAPAPTPAVSAPAPTSPRGDRKPSSEALIGEQIGGRKPSQPTTTPPAEPSLKTSQPIKAPAADPSLKTSGPLDTRKPSVEGPPPSQPAQRAELKLSASRLAAGDEGTAMIGGRRRTAVAPPMEQAPPAPLSPKKDSVGAGAAPVVPPIKTGTVSAGSGQPAAPLSPKKESISAASAPTAASTSAASSAATATANIEDKKAGDRRAVRGTFLAGNRRATVMEKPPLAGMEDGSAAPAQSRQMPSGSIVGRDWLNSGLKSQQIEKEPENISPNLPVPVRRAARLQLGAQREEEDFFHLHKDDHGYYLLETPWQFRCFLRRLDEGGEGSDDAVVRVSLQGLLLERVDGLWMLNPSGYHTIGPRSTEAFTGDPAECLFELNGGVTVRYNRAKWELLDAYVAEASAAHVVQEQHLPTITYKIRNYKQFPSEVKSHLSELDDAVDLLNQHFEQAADPVQWHALGDEEQTPALGELVRRRLAGALVYALSYGFNASKGFFGGSNHIWHFIESYLERTSFRQLLALGLVRTVRAVNAAFNQDDCDGKLRAFLCNSLNSGLLHEYLQLLAANDEAVERFFQPSSLLRVPALLTELIASTEPLSVFSFRLKSGLKGADDSVGAAPQPEPLTPVERLWEQLGADVETNEQSGSSNALPEQVTPYEAPPPSSEPSAADVTKTPSSGRSGSPSRVAASGVSPQRGRPGATSPQRTPGSDRATSAPTSVSPQRERPTGAAGGVSPQRERPTVQLKERALSTSPQRERPPSLREVSAPAPAPAEEGLLSSLGKSLSSWWG